MYPVELLFPENATVEDKALISTAYTFAQRAHEGQQRHSGEPYFSHVYETARNVQRLGMHATLIAAALLHDTVEDTPVTEQDIVTHFGEDIASLIRGVTKLGTVKYKGVERNVENLRKFFVSMADDLRVIIIKLADRLHNVQTLEHVRSDKQQRIALETLEVYAPLANRLSMGKLKGELEDAAFKVADPKAYAEVTALLEEKKDASEHYLHEVHAVLQKKLQDNAITHTIDYRVKHRYSLWKKLQKYDTEIDKVHDIIALRVIVDSIEDCYHVLGIIHGTWTPLPGRIKDYIATPKPNGYQSIHTTIFTGTGGIVEIQIRTTAMHEVAENGIAAHFSYKEGTRIENQNVAWIKELKELQKNLDKPDLFLQALKMDFFRDRIFVFSPKGDIIDLPEGASAIDFAYAIHSDIGDTAMGAKVNGKFSALSTKLQNQDVVEIVTKKDAKPSAKWLSFTKTALARRHISAAIKKDEGILDRLFRFGKS